MRRLLDGLAAGRQSAESARRLAVVPVAPVLALYLPSRIRGAHRRDAVRRALEHRLEEWLARRAVARLPLDRLRMLSDDPWLDLAVGRHEALACAELERLGLSSRERSR